MITLLLLAGLFAADPAWKEFSDWFSREGTPGAPSDVLKSYAARLKAGGSADDAIQARVAEVQAYMRAHPGDALVLHFNRIYTWADAPFSREPSALLKKVAGSRKPGRALDIAMGQGRNSIWLAKEGWSVSGYDISDEALRQAQAGAEAAGVKVATTLASHEQFELGKDQWDLIVMSFAFTALSDTAYMNRVRESLKPGGVLLVEGFNGGPRKERNMILKSFVDSYHVLLFEDLPDISDWGKMKAPLLRMALEKQ